MTEPHVRPAAREGSSGFDTVFRALADENRRHVLRYFQTTGDTVASVDDLIDFTEEWVGNPVDRDRLAVAFHHVALPHLAESRFVDYDARNRAVRYRGDPRLERTMSLVSE